MTTTTMYFDAIILGEVLEHLKEKREITAEIEASLKEVIGKFIDSK